MCLGVEESSQEASKSNYKYLTWYYLSIQTDVKRDVWEVIPSSFRPCVGNDDDKSDDGHPACVVLSSSVSDVTADTEWLASPDADAEGPKRTEPNKDDMSIERRNIGERPTTTENGMYQLAF